MTLDADESEFKAKLKDLEAQNAKLRQDIAERTDRLGSAALDLLEANEIKDRFLGIAAHDLRNPLISIRSLSELIKDGKVDLSQQEKFISLIHSTSQHMLDLLNDLLDVSVMESGQMDLRVAETDLGDLLEQRLTLQDVKAANKQIQIHRDFQPVPQISIDGARVGQVIDNLLSNAIKFSEPETKITVSLRASDGQVRLTVSDQGQGIPLEEQERLFLPFERLSVESTAGEKSTGLGMFIVKQIVDAHGGTIDVSSSPGDGTSITVTLPRD